MKPKLFHELKKSLRELELILKRKQSPSRVWFVTKSGKRKLVLPGDATIAQLRARGITLHTVPRNKPWKRGELRNEE